MTNEPPLQIRMPVIQKNENGTPIEHTNEYRTFTFTDNRIDPDDYEVATSSSDRKRIQRRIIENAEDGVGFFKPIPDNPTSDDCGRASLLETAQERLQRLFDADHLKAMAEALNDNSFNLTDHIPNVGFIMNPGSSITSGESYMATSFAASFVCITIDLSSEIDLEFDFRQKIELDCTEMIETIRDTCTLPNNQLGCQAVNETAQIICSVGDITQSMLIALDFEAIINTEITNEILEALKQDLDNHKKTTDDLFKGLIDALVDLGVVLTGSDKDELFSMVADATALFVSTIDISTVNEIFQRFKASQLIRVTGTNARVITQAMLLEVAISVVIENSLSNRVDRDFSQAVKNMWEYYVKSLDDYLRALMGPLIVAVIIIAAIIGVLIVVGGISFLIIRSSKGKKTQSLPPNGSIRTLPPANAGTGQTAVPTTTPT